MVDTALKIELLGELTVLRDGDVVALPQSRKTRALLAYLILEPGPHRREKLCELFWQVPDDPRGSLRWSLSKLRSIVNDSEVERIVADRERVQFNDADVSIDIAAIEKAVSGGPSALTQDDLDAMANAFTGDLLEGLDFSGQPDFETWRLAQQERARNAQRQVLRALTEKLAGDPSAKADRLAALVRLDPYDVTVHAELIASLAQATRTKEAERQKELSVAVLKDVEGVDLSVLERALDQKPAATTTAPASETPMGTPPSEPKPAALQQEIRFCKAADGVQIAYASVGEGPPLVKSSNWLNHLEFDWESPVWRHFFRALGIGRRLIRYDARGNGLSDWNTRDFSLERQVSDLEAVVDAMELEQFPLFGISQGCAVCVEYAVRHPERVTKLVLYGGYARGWRIAGNKRLAEQVEAMITLMKLGWGQDNPAFRQMFTSQFMPDAPVENQAWFNELQRMTTSPKNAARLLHTLGDVDIRPRLADIKAPTLVMHANEDMRVPFQSGRELAAGIPGALFSALESKNHLMPESDPAFTQLMEKIDAFLAE